MGLFGPSQNEVWSQIARDIGGDYIESGFWQSGNLRYRHGGWEILLDTFTETNSTGPDGGTTQSSFTRMRSPYTARTISHSSSIELVSSAVSASYWAVKILRLVILFSTMTSSSRAISRSQKSLCVIRAGLAIGKGVAAAAVLAGLLALAVRMPHLYGVCLGDRPDIEATGVASLTEEYTLDGDEWGGYKCVLWGDSRIGKEISTRHCTLGDFSKADRRVLVLGDSFSAAFTQSFDDLVALG